MGYLQRFTFPHFTRSSDGGKLPDFGGWQRRHLEAVITPVGAEIALVGLVRSWAIYADAHKARYESGIGADGVLGPQWATIGASLRGLLNGESGRLDCGTLDGFINDTLTAEGFAPDTL